MTTPNDLFREWLHRQLVGRHLSHAQLALRSGVDRSTVGRILSGNRGPSLDTAVRLVEALDDSLLSGVYARLQSPSSHADRVARLLREDPRLSEAAATDVFNLYRELRD